MAVWSKLLSLKDAEAGNFSLARVEINEALGKGTWQAFENYCGTMKI
jgi:hypothetical protein